MQIVKEPYLRQLRTEVTELKRLVDGEPDATVAALAWASLAKIKQTLGELCPNHPAIMLYR
jgi:hypothetical protein